ncbi:pyridoxal phosphate-dependent transferase [Annulohypoxylon truncatum]|uniref:pyridoxal phosphate-dependent transferase n=1 Tax=Annulohypoxylon truncatum TaxID=327061 RepID=UPI002007538E|nr:pyridoxal phosphate-dependent transferase [Annulohypoxylon truncatum]KAI1206392.1 pyridoxal phosphate-dependent transferase [Annulohypoxylon truncatum]
MNSFGIPLSGIAIAEVLRVGHPMRRHRTIKKLGTPLLPSISIHRLSQSFNRERLLHIPSATMSTFDTPDGKPASSWLGHQGAAAFDLRSDTMTTPTQNMLFAIQHTTLLDDVFEEDPTTIDLETHVASLTGKEAALFVLSGTMGNQIALRSLLTRPPHGVLADHRSHIIKYEAGGVTSLTGAMTTPIAPRNGLYLTLEDIESNVVLGEEIHSCPTRVISLENSLNGLIMPLDEVKRISEFAREHGILMHCDGARLWEVVASGAGSLPDFCQYFDTISLCFSKGLGAPIGSIIVGNKSLIKHARWVRKSIGGGLRQSGVVTAAARVAVDVTFGKGPNGESGLLRDTHLTAKRVEKLWTSLGGRMEYPVQTNMVWLDLQSLNCSPSRFAQLGRQVGLKVSGNRIITHYQIGEEAIKRLASIFEKVASERGASNHDKDHETLQRDFYGSKV